MAQAGPSSELVSCVATAGPRKTAASFWVAAALAAYLAGFLLYRPHVSITSDETAYVAQAYAFAQGKTRLLEPSLFSGAGTATLPSGYPPGTSLLQAVFVHFAGWSAAPWASVLCVILTVAILSRWLYEENRSPLYGLVFLGYLPTLILGRTALSELPSAAVVTLGLWLCIWNVGNCTK